MLPYTHASRTDTWDVLKLSDADPTNTSRIQLIYSGATILPGARGEEYAHGWTREHLYAQSLGGFHASVNDAPATDLHALRASSGACNSVRSNRLFGVVATRPTSRPDCELNCVSGVCEPADREKGRIARALLYMAIRYAGVNDTRDTPGNATWPQLRIDAVATSAALLVEWSERFPPDAFEIARNNVIAQPVHQGNANPFISTPALARCLFAPGSAAQTTCSSTRTSC